MSLRFAKDELRYYVYLGRTPTKKVKTLNFKAGVPGPVWDRKIHALMTRLPYFRLATEAEIAAVEAEAKKAAPAPKAKRPAPIEIVQAEPANANAERDALRAQLDAKSIGYDKRWGVKALREQLALATPKAIAEPVDREFAEVFNG